MPSKKGERNPTSGGHFQAQRRRGAAIEQAIRGIRSVTMWVSTSDRTGAVLTGALGFREMARDGSFIRYSTGDGETASTLRLSEPAVAR